MRAKTGHDAANAVDTSATGRIRADAGVDTRAVTVIIALALALVATVLLSFALGRFPVGPRELWEVIAGALGIGPPADPQFVHVVANLRFPRIAAAALIGLALSTAGLVYQGMFRNPLVSPDLLGASSGAGFGASLAIITGAGLLGIQLYAFVFGLVAVLLAWGISLRMKRDALLGLLLAGIVVSAVLSAGTNALKYLADPDDELPAITFWLLGGLNGVRSDQLPFLVVPIAGCAAILWLCRWRLDVMTFGEDTARSLGVSVKALRAIVIVTATLLTTTSVAIGGLIAWVGLVVPHLMRLTIGPGHRTLMPATMLAGAVFLLLVDDLARNLLTMELPLGVLTAAIGAPFLLVLISLDREW